MDITEVLQKNLCEPHLKSRQKRTVLEEIAALLKQHPSFESISVKEILNALEEREKLGSTGFGDGVAIPHCRLPGLDHFVMGIGVSKRGVHFDAIDNRKVYLFCFILGPEDRPNEHVQILASISQVLKEESAKKELCGAQTATGLYESYLRRAFYKEDAKEAKDLKLLMLVLQDEEYLNDVMELFVEMGIKGVSVIESNGMGKILTSVPLFASFINFLGGAEGYHRTIFTIVPAQQLSRIVSAVEEITGDMDKRTGALALALDISMIKGSLQTI
jgi:PTS system nitrogen regulatory IIA component